MIKVYADDAESCHQPLVQLRIAIPGSHPTITDEITGSTKGVKPKM